MNQKSRRPESCTPRPGSEWPPEETKRTKCSSTRWGRIASCAPIASALLGSVAQLKGPGRAIGAALDGRVMTRQELVLEVGRLTGSVAFGAKLAESSWGTILKPAAFSGRLCFGPSLGQRVRFTRPDTWLAVAPRENPQ